MFGFGNEREKGPILDMRKVGVERQDDGRVLQLKNHAGVDLLDAHVASYTVTRDALIREKERLEEEIRSRIMELRSVVRAIEGTDAAMAIVLKGPAESTKYVSPAVAAAAAEQGSHSPKPFDPNSGE